MTGRNPWPSTSSSFHDSLIRRIGTSGGGRFTTFLVIVKELRFLVRLRDPALCFA
jgi:hypothetical protein